jgi:hypothetical protein
MLAGWFRRGAVAACSVLVFYGTKMESKASIGVLDIVVEFKGVI